MSEDASSAILGVLLVMVLLWPWPLLITYRKGLSLAPIFLATIIFYPLALVIAIVSNRDMEVLDARRLAKGEQRKCPHCAEFIRREARVCPKCQRDLPAAA